MTELHVAIGTSQGLSDVFPFMKVTSSLWLTYHGAKRAPIEKCYVEPMAAFSVGERFLHCSRSKRKDDMRRSVVCLQLCFT